MSVKYPGAGAVGGPNAIVAPSMILKRISRHNSLANAAVQAGIDGINGFSAIGTLTAAAVASTNLATRLRRTGWPSGAVAGNLGGWRCGQGLVFCGSGTPLDGTGFLYVERFVEADPATVAGRRAFAGLRNTLTAPTNVEPNTLVNSIGVAQLSTDATQWYLVYGGSSAQSAIALGTALGAPAGNSTTAWELQIYAPNGEANTYYVTLKNLSTGAVSVTTKLTGDATQVPQSSTLLGPMHWLCNNATAAVVGSDLVTIYLETDY